LRKFYVILTDWEYVLKGVVGWSDNPYIAISYFREYKQMDEESEMITIECESTMVLVHILNEEYATDIHDILGCHLVTKTSKDGRCYVIYKERYAELFSDEYTVDIRISSQIFSILTHTMLQASPLVPYLKTDSIDLISTLLFVAYQYTSIKQMLRSGPRATPVSELLDMIYFWRYLDKTNVSHLTSIQGTGADSYPADAIYID
jgi:hypothetical protein